MSESAFDRWFPWLPVVVVAIGFAAILYKAITYTEPPPEPCETYKDWPISRVPARCAKHFGVGQ